MFPSDPHDSDEDVDQDDLSDDDDIRDPDYQQCIEEALAEDAVDPDDFLSPPRKKPKGKHMLNLRLDHIIISIILAQSASICLSVFLTIQ